MINEVSWSLDSKQLPLDSLAIVHRQSHYFSQIPDLLKYNKKSTILVVAVITATDLWLCVFYITFHLLKLLHCFAYLWISGICNTATVHIAPFSNGLLFLSVLTANHLPLVSSSNLQRYLGFTQICHLINSLLYILFKAYHTIFQSLYFLYDIPLQIAGIFLGKGCCFFFSHGSRMTCLFFQGLANKQETSTRFYVFTFSTHELKSFFFSHKLYSRY